LINKDSGTFKKKKDSDGGVHFTKKGLSLEENYNKVHKICITDFGSKMEKGIKDRSSFSSDSTRMTTQRSTSIRFTTRV
jgi:hypothetical protein